MAKPPAANSFPNPANVGYVAEMEKGLLSDVRIDLSIEFSSERASEMYLSSSSAFPFYASWSEVALTTPS